MANKIPYTIRIDEYLYEKIKYIAKKDVRSVNNLFELLLVRCVEDYEAKNGTIDFSVEE